MLAKLIEKFHGKPPMCYVVINVDEAEYKKRVRYYRDNLRFMFDRDMIENCLPEENFFLSSDLEYCISQILQKLKKGSCSDTQMISVLGKLIEASMNHSIRAI